MKARAKGSDLVLTFETKSEKEAFEMLLNDGYQQAHKDRRDARAECLITEEPWNEVKKAKDRIVTARILDEAMTKISPSGPGKELQVKDVFRSIEYITGKSEEQLKGRERHKPTVRARFIFFAIVATYMRLSQNEMVDVLNRHHATAVNGIRSVKKDAQFYEHYEDILEVVRDLNARGFNLSEAAMLEFLQVEKKS